MKQREADQKIVKFLCGERITLSSKEEEILSRWRHVDQLMRLGKADHEIKDSIVKHFGVSPFTADIDYYNAQKAFSQVLKIDKTYLLGMHIEGLRMDVINYRSQIFKANYSPTEKEIAALSKLTEAYTYALNSLPQTTTKAAPQRTILMFSLKNGNPVNAPMQVDDALKLADEMIEEAEIVTDEG